MSTDNSTGMKAWFMRTTWDLSFWDRVRLLFGRRLFISFDSPSGDCSAGCELSYAIVPRRTGEHPGKNRPRPICENLCPSVAKP